MRVKSAFEHERFKEYVIAVIKPTDLKENWIAESYNTVKSGLALPTWKFIEFCNYMNVDPRLFITYKI